MNKIAGHHHISMVTKNAQLNNRFYQEILGLRRVKKTVNQDDPTMYHLFYGDLTGSPGTELTFFEMPMVGSTHRGTNAITKIGLLVSSYDSLVYWKERFSTLHVKHSDITAYAGREALHFEDYEGLRMVLLNNRGEYIPEHWKAWKDSGVKNTHRILGMGAIEITVQSLHSLANTLEQLFGYERVSPTTNEAIYQSVKGQAFGEIVIVEKDGPNERPGKGSVHHLAIRVKNSEELRVWYERIKDFGFTVMKITDRFYFESLYFKEENGIVFELATDGPGFTVDSSVETLGQKLDLPPFLERKRAEIEARLAPLD
ncbi:ring-cleaving dioxygenase [Pseudogracilibacillus auburnensis]|uniref:Glyoxalase family protein n=1 Tax=Pseudogracilibacillus auburnensis TaxID=1494959 RepID=A0A2V3VSS0_9BACI|nr:ring-cleaving dioxygenase [Pseudogracilibacillus auburnensis]MBO1001366.1 ring-cleaving dioxygenase [Pseudogracilibacillus auburnensis]PXW83758.1 glyoxalase family protein [Pseudogracilibacillus auburnensis]